MTVEILKTKETEKDKREKKTKEKPIPRMKEIELVEKRGIVPGGFYTKLRARFQSFFTPKTDSDEESENTTPVEEVPRREPPA